jgi:uncharacterized protein YcfJ
MTGALRYAGSLLAAIAVLVSGCATSPAEPRLATVIGISTYQRQNPDKQTAGAAAGLMVGALIGSQIGAGTGTAVAMTVGALGGAYVGSKIASRNDEETVHDITYRYDDGTVGNLTLRGPLNVKIGERVRVYPDYLDPA